MELRDDKKYYCGDCGRKRYVSLHPNNHILCPPCFISATKEYEDQEEVKLIRELVEADLKVLKHSRFAWNNGYIILLKHTDFLLDEVKKLRIVNNFLNGQLDRMEIEGKMQ